MLRRPGTAVVSQVGLAAANSSSPLPRARPPGSARDLKLLEKIADFFRGGRNPAHLAVWMALPEADLREWIPGRPPEPRGRQYSYARFTIPKRRGGEREIHAPSDALKDLQRRILQRLLNPLPAHSAASGFVLRRSIVDNARPHAGQGVVINIDLADFFPSIPAERVYEAFRALGWGRETARILTNICTHEGRLPQGAPTSPALSNLVCRRLDARLAALAKSSGGHYTRYADDLTLSFPWFGSNRPRRPRRKKNSLVPSQLISSGAGAVPAPRRQRSASRGLLTTIRKILEEEGFRIQMKKKVRVQRPHQRQTATGLVVNRRVNLPRSVRRRIRAMQHHERTGRLDRRGILRLRGWESLLGMVSRQREPRGPGTPL